MGRADDVIISGGENISLEYVKKHIEKIDGVDFCKLKKVESSNWGQVLHASIKCNKNITEHSIRIKLNERLANYMIPKNNNNMILIVDNFDSFTFNLVQYIGSINNNLKIIKNNELSIEEILDLNISHIVISPGPEDLRTLEFV